MRQISHSHRDKRSALSPMIKKKKKTTREKKKKERTDTDSEGRSGKQNLGKHMLMQHRKNMNSYQTKVGKFGTGKTSEPMIAQEYCFHHTGPMLHRKLLTLSAVVLPGEFVCGTA